MTTSLRIDIVGGGIGGIALAASLSRLGLRCQVFEQAPQLKAVGYGLTLQKNAIQARGRFGSRPDASSDVRESTCVRCTARPC